MALFIGNKQIDIFSAANNNGIGGETKWGDITGNLSNQTDLDDKLTTITSATEQIELSVTTLNSEVSSKATKTEIDSKFNQISAYVRDQQTLQLGDFIDVLGTYMSKVVATDMTQAQIPTFVTELHDAIKSTDPRGFKRVICWGDSLTKRSSIQNKLKTLLDAAGNSLNVINNGVSWDKSYQVALRQGAIKMKANPFTIPASGSVNFTYPLWNGKIDMNVYLDGTGAVFTDADQNFRFNPCTIDGIEGTLTRTTTENLTFTRTYSGEAKTISRPVDIDFYCAKSYNNIDDMAVIFVGTNDGHANVDQAIEFTKLIADNIKSRKYIIVGLESGNTASGIVDDVFKQAKAFGTKFLNIYERMLNYGIDDYQTITGITLDETTTPKLSECLSDVAEGRIPRCLRVDNTHFNETGYSLMCQLIYEKGKQLEYWN